MSATTGGSERRRGGAEQNGSRTGGIPEGELNALAVNSDVGNVVLEDGGHVNLRGDEDKRET